MHKINYICFGNTSGYSQAAQDTILALHYSGRYDVRVQYIYGNTIKQSGMSKNRSNIMSNLQEKEFDKDCWQIFHCIPSLQKQSAKKNVSKHSAGFATYETFEPPNNGSAGWVHQLNKNDAVICPSRFNEKIFKHAGVHKPIFYIPHGCDDKLYDYSILPMINRDRFTFLFFSEWRVRKGYKVLFEAWFHEFSAKDNVQLLIKTNKTQTAKSTLSHIKKEIGLDKKKTAPVFFEDNVFDENSLPKFIKSADCLVSPTRGEGFGLPGLQCMFLKVPVIISNFSGCQEYANKNTAYLLEPRGYELINEGLDALPQFRNKKWPIITVSDTRKAMREVFENQDMAKQKTEKAYNFVKDKFTYKNIVEGFDKMVEFS